VLPEIARPHIPVIVSMGGVSVGAAYKKPSHSQFCVATRISSSGKSAEYELRHNARKNAG
jgi:hypothetical protein